MIEPSDDEIVARVEASNRVMWRLVRVLCGGLALVGVIVAALVCSGHADWQRNCWFQMAVAAVVGALFLYVLVMMARHHVPAIETMNPRLARRRIDAQQRHWRWAILGYVVIGFSFVLNQADALRNLTGLDEITRLVLGLGPSLFPLLMVAILTVGPRWQCLDRPGLGALVDDEFAVALRARTMRVGYVVAMILLAAIVLVTLWRPALTLTALCWALFAGSAVPALYYVIADWRASREETP
jgi:hypothetical protein